MTRSQRPVEVDALVVGAGFAGLYLLHKFRGMGLTARIVEAGSGVGGTWFWNRYPGARCDIESMQYSYSFDEALQQEWRWSERYATQSEILAYLNHVADRFDLRRDIDFDTRVISSVLNEQTDRWAVTCEDGRSYSARFCVLATGCLSSGDVPDIPGLERFKGRVLRTGTWPTEDVSFDGRKVAVVGTGSSGTQAIPMIARQAEKLYVLQRTPNFSIPARNMQITDEIERSWKSDYASIRKNARENFPNGTIRPLGEQPAKSVSPEERERIFEEGWRRGGIDFMWIFSDLATDDESNAMAADFVRRKIAELVADPSVAERLTPQDYPIGAKRICIDTGYYETFNRPNVELIDLKTSPLTSITETGFETSGGAFDVDDLVFATGFDAMTGAVSRIEISGRDGEKLNDKWAAGPKTYLGLMTAGFPNLFFITGPGSPSVLGNVVVSIEQHVDWLAGLIETMSEKGALAVEADADAENDWMDQVQKAAEGTLYMKAASWYLGANIPGKPRVFMPYAGGVHKFRRICNEVREDGYRGIEFQAGVKPREPADQTVT